MPNTDMSRQGMKRRKSKNNLEMDDDIDNNNINVEYDHHFVDKDSILREYMEKVHIRVFIIKFSLIILISLLYGITMSCVNITKSYSLSTEQQYTFNNNKISNIIYNIFLRSSSLSMLFIQKEFEYIVLLNTLLVIFLVLIVILLATFIIKELQQMKKSYMEQVRREEEYSLLIELKRPINKSEIKGFIEYFESIITMAVGEKVLELNIKKEQQLTRQEFQQIEELFEFNEHMHYLESIVNKLTLVQDVILLPELKQQEKEKHLKQQNHQQQNHPQQEEPIHNNNYSHHIIAILSYPELKQTLLEWFNIEKNREKISTQIISIKETPSPLDYMFGKYVGAIIDENGNTEEQESKRYITRTNGHKKLIVLGIVIELLYIAILSTCIYFSQFPHHLLPSHIIESFNQEYISYILLLIESIVMFIYTKLYHEKFINEKLIKSLPECVTRSKEMNLESMLSITLLLTNIFIVPLTAELVVQLVRYDWDVNNKMGLIIENIIWGEETSYGFLLICYVIIKWVIYEPMVNVINKVKSNSCYHNREENNNNNNNINDNFEQHLQLEQEQYNNSTAHYHTIYESTIIFSLSIFINPFISLLPLINLIIITIKLFLEQTQNHTKSYKEKHPEMCFVVFCSYHVYVIKVVLYLMICLGLLIGNGLLLVYGYEVELIGQYYCVIVTVVVAILMIVFVNVFIEKVNVPKCFSILPIFPIEEFKPIKNHNQNPEEYEPHHENNNNIYINNPTHLPSNIASSHRKEKHTATLLINRIYTNQEFLFTYNEEMRKSAYFLKYNKNRVENNNIFELKNNNNNNNNKLNSTQKITEELNTMSRSLEETLKQRLMTNSTNPFQITQPTKEDYEEEFDEPYEIKVNMRHSKPKTVRIPMLNLQQPKEEIIREDNNAARIMRKTTIEEGKDINKNFTKNNSQYNNLKQKQPNQLKNRLFKTNKKQKEELDSDAECDILSSIDKEDNQERDKLDKQKNNSLEKELQDKKVKFTDLFDSDEESIKNIVKKKIKQSIPRITY